jgi:hypothetical protein
MYIKVYFTRVPLVVILILCHKPGKNPKSMISHSSLFEILKGILGFGSLSSLSSNILRYAPIEFLMFSFLTERSNYPISC